MRYFLLMDTNVYSKEFRFKCLIEIKYVIFNILNRYNDYYLNLVVFTKFF